MANRSSVIWSSDGNAPPLVCTIQQSAAYSRLWLAAAGHRARCYSRYMSAAAILARQEQSMTIRKAPKLCGIEPDELRGGACVEI